MNLFTKDEVEDRYAIEAVEYLSASIPNQLFYWVLVCMAYEVCEAMVGYVAEKVVKANSKTPACKYLVVGMYAVIDPAECDSQANSKSHR